MLKAAVAVGLALRLVAPIQTLPIAEPEPLRGPQIPGLHQSKEMLLGVEPQRRTPRQRRLRHARITQRYTQWLKAKEQARVDTRIHHVLVLAKSRLGAAYAWGASGPWAFDCSGFTRWVAAHFGKYLPHSAQAQASLVPRASSVEPGDLLFFSYGRKGPGVIDHVEYALTGAKSIGASNPTEDVDIDMIDWSNLVAVGRVDW